MLYYLFPYNATEEDHNMAVFRWEELRRAYMQTQNMKKTEQVSVQIDNLTT